MTRVLLPLAALLLACAAPAHAGAPCRQPDGFPSACEWMECNTWTHEEPAPEPEWICCEIGQQAGPCPLVGSPADCPSTSQIYWCEAGYLLPDNTVECFDEG